MGAAALIWIVLGCIAGFIGNKMLNRRGEPATIDIGIGIAGAVIGGWIFHRFSTPGAATLSFWNLIVPICGAITLLTLWNTIRRTTSRA